MAAITETAPAAIREKLTRLRLQLGRDLPKKTDRRARASESAEQSRRLNASGA